MSTRTEKPAGGGGLSVTTLAIASVSSVVAAFFIHKVWSGGAILGAGLTPVIVAIVSESLKKPTQRITAIREERRTRTTVARGTPDRVPTAPPPELERPDPYGIWQDEKRQSGRFHWVRGRALKLAVVTGLVAFALAAIVVTGAELVFGGDDRGLTYVPGNQGRESEPDEDDAEPATTQPAETTPEEQTETVPPATTTEPPPATTPAPTTEQPAPAPTPEQPAPAPEQPAPTP